TVMQNGYIFSDTIAKNIALDGEVINEELLKQSVRVSNLKEFIEELPFQYDTKLGNSGMGLSGGQIQRILIARAIYKDP
ncbi:ATP-binding cassette domain-containing protein, partial [Salmonella enterica]